ncbi:hypothetical protein E4U53_003999, partial [Claviceps sorghi]
MTALWSRLLRPAALLLAATWQAGVSRGAPVVEEARTTVSSEESGMPSVVPVANVTAHGPYTGAAATTTGAESASV